jgi:hypothetical protein
MQRWLKEIKCLLFVVDNIEAWKSEKLPGSFFTGLSEISKTGAK